MILPSKDSPVLQRSSSDAPKAVVDAPVGSGDANENKSKWLDIYHTLLLYKNKLL